MTKPISGVWTAMVTPVAPDNRVDIQRLNQHAHNLLQLCDGVVLFGSTGEAPSFSNDDRCQALEALLESGVDAGRVIVGTGCTSLSDTALLTGHAASLNVAGTLVVPPFYFKNVEQAGVLKYYEELIESIGSAWSLYLYHFPKLSGVPLSVGLVEEIRRRHPETVVGIKDSTGDMESVREFLKVDGLAVFPGTERVLVDAQHSGVSGVITATGNVNAANIAAAWERGEGIADMLEVRGALEDAGTIIGAKAYLAHQYNDDNWNRVLAPFVSLAAESRDKFVEEMAALVGR